MSFDRFEHAGNAIQSSLLADIGSSDATCTLVDATGWPTGAVGPFWIVIDAGQVGEEKCLVTARSSNSLTGMIRGADGTAASIHSASAVVKHIFSAQEADEANQTAVATLGQIAAKGDLLVGSASQTLDAVTVGADGLPLVGNAAATTGVAWGPVSAAGIGTGAVTTTKLAAGAVTSAAIADGTIVTADLADSAVTINKLAVNAVESIVTEQTTTLSVPTSGTTESTLATITVAAQALAYNAILHVHYVGLGTVQGDVFDVRIYQGASLVDSIRAQVPATPFTTTFSFTATQSPVAISTGATFTAKIARVSGSGTMSDGLPGQFGGRLVFQR